MGQVGYLVEILKLAAIHAMAVRHPVSGGGMEEKSIVTANAQVQNVIQNFRHHVQASLESFEFDTMRRGDSFTRAHILDSEYYKRESSARTLRQGTR